jgi:GntR family transcriptional regulator
VVTRASERLTIDLANQSDIETLQLKGVGSVVVIERIAYGLDGAALEWRVSRGNANHFSYTIDIR